MSEDNNWENIENDQREAYELQAKIDELERIVRPRFTKEALIRYGNIKAAHHERAVHVLIILGQLIQQGKLNTIDDDQLKSLLLHLSTRKDFRIKRR
jgi:DNA-binding TFAR19-related protein (PDSD5 family)